MANKRLNSWDRERLRKLAAELVDCPAEREAEDAAYAKAAPLIRKAIERRYPPKDMEVLKRYDQSFKSSSVKFEGYDKQIYCFWFRDGEEFIEPRHSPYIIFSANKTTHAAAVAYFDAKRAHEDARDAVLADYRALINNCSSFNKLAELWPEAEQLRTEIVGNLPSVITHELVERVQADVQKRAEKKAA